MSHWSLSSSVVGKRLTCTKIVSKMNFLALIAHFWPIFIKLEFLLLYWVKPYAWAAMMGQPSRHVSLVFELKCRRKTFNVYKNRLENELFGFDCSFLAVFQQN